MVDIAEQFAPGAWEFTPEVTDVFDEHVSASVPFYPMIQNIVAEASDWLLPAHGVFVDVGSSTGTTAAAIATRHPERRIRVYLYDEVPEMMTHACEKLKSHPSLVVEKKIQTVTAPMNHVPSDLVTSLFLLQFLPPEQRRGVLEQLHRLSKPSGALLVAEKIRPTDSAWAEIAIDASHDFKERCGLSDTAIRQKSQALRGVLRPSTHAELVATMTGAGWTRVETLFRWHQWVVMGAFAS